MAVRLSACYSFLLEAEQIPGPSAAGKQNLVCIAHESLRDTATSHVEQAAYPWASGGGILRLRVDLNHG
jgi:hypothetical protein